MVRLLIAIIVVGTIARAHASTIELISAERLYAESDRIVDGTVIAKHVRRVDHGLETVATIAIATGGTVELVVPGGTLDGARHVVLGAPAVAIGEHARWFLRDRGDGALGVYGWSQGKWPAGSSGDTYAPAPIRAEHPTTIAQFTVNGMQWPITPVPYLVNRQGSDDMAIEEVEAAVDAAFATWRVPCSSLAFVNTGRSNRKLDTDGHNVVLFIESGWVYGEEAAAVTSLWIVDGEQTADIAMNGQRFTWANGPSNSAYATTLDLQAVLTHEVGHFIGLGHTDRAHDTMYYTWKPWQGQRTLSIDDKLGACSLYPAFGHECGTCPAEETCVEYPQGRLCRGTPDPTGAACDADRVECEAFCLFTAVDLSSGYCSTFCTSDTDCPLTHHCAPAVAGEETVQACFVGAQMPPDPPHTCAIDDECPIGQHCDGERGACTFECRDHGDCDHGTCNARGVCEALLIAGGGCNSSGAAIGVCVFALALRRRRR